MGNKSDILEAFFETDFPLNKEGIEELLSLFNVRFYNKNSLILKAGGKEKQLRFLETGIVREFYATEDKETNINFYTKPQFITDFSSLNNSAKTKKNQTSLTDIVLKTIDRGVFLKLLDKYECGKEIVNLTFQRMLEKKEQFEYSRITKTPEELYKELLENQPDWLQNIPQYHIASYLGVTPETLSRIRNRIS